MLSLCDVQGQVRAVWGQRALRLKSYKNEMHLWQWQVCSYALTTCQLISWSAAVEEAPLFCTAMSAFILFYFFKLSSGSDQLKYRRILWTSADPVCLSKRHCAVWAAFMKLEAITSAYAPSPFKRSRTNTAPAVEANPCSCMRRTCMKKQAHRMCGAPRA